MKSKFSILLSTAVVVGLGIGASPASAAPISGQLQITGSAQVAATFLSFLCSGIAGGTCPTGYGDFIALGSQTGSFTGYNTEKGYIGSLDTTNAPLNQAFMYTNWLYFYDDDGPGGFTPDIALDLTFIPLGTYGQAECAAPENQSQIPAQQCTPVIGAPVITSANPLGLSAFNLANTLNGSTASFQVVGLARRISTGELSNFNGTFSAQFTNTPGQTDASYQDILAQFAQGSVTSSYSATFVANFTPSEIPEPGTYAMMMGGGLLIGLSALRRRRKA